MIREVRIGHVLDELAKLEPESVQCVVTSPPYWSLRKYAGEQEVLWPSPSADTLGANATNRCEHEWVDTERIKTMRALPPEPGHTRDDNERVKTSALQAPELRGRYGTCRHCGSWRGAYGLEAKADCGAWTAAFRGEQIVPCAECYVCHTLTILRAIRRVLRPDGTVWWNIGDSYASSGQGDGQPQRDAAGGVFQSTRGRQRQRVGARAPHSATGLQPGLKPKDLVGMPARVALAAQADGWWWRSEIIWAKTAPMPESVTDRPTSAHEKILLLTKSARYYYDADAVREKGIYTAEQVRKQALAHKRRAAEGRSRSDGIVADLGDMMRNLEPYGTGTRNLRDVWTMNTEPYPDAHFAVFPSEIPRKAILAGSPPKCCAACGAPWARVVEKERRFESGSGRSGNLPTGKHGPDLQGGGETLDVRRGPCVDSRTLGWRPTCECKAGTKPSLVLDPFAGTGTTAQVAESLGRSWVLIEIAPEYEKLIRKRIAQPSMATEMR